MAKDSWKKTIGHISQVGKCVNCVVFGVFVGRFFGVTNQLHGLFAPRYASIIHAAIWLCVGLGNTIAAKTSWKPCSFRVLSAVSSQLDSKETCQVGRVFSWFWWVNNHELLFLDEVKKVRKKEQTVVFVQNLPQLDPKQIVIFPKTNQQKPHKHFGGKLPTHPNPSSFIIPPD